MALPIGINMIFTIYILKKEIKRPKFHQWFIAHRKVASGFIVLSCTNIRTLNILHSNSAGLPFFRAPFSDNAKSKIFWGNCLNLVIVDFFQLAFLVSDLTRDSECISFVDVILYVMYTVGFRLITLLLVMQIILVHSLEIDKMY